VNVYERVQGAIADLIRAAMEASAPWDVQVVPRMLHNPTPPSIDVYPADPSNDPETAGFAETVEDASGGIWINVRARVPANDNAANQNVLLELKSPDSSVSLVQAVYDDPTLAGNAADVNLDNESGFVLVPTIDGSATHLGVIWRFLVLPAYS
jgi:hypothetical protein